MVIGGAACSTSRVKHAELDPAVLDDCPRTIEAPGELVELQPFTLPDSRVVVPFDNAVAHSNMLARGALVFRGAWFACRSVVIYAEDRDRALAD